MNKARREERRRQKEEARRRNPDPLWWMEAESLYQRLQHDMTDDMAKRIMEKFWQYSGPDTDKFDLVEEFCRICFDGLESYRQECERIQHRLNPAPM